jgi:hypothetical protein
MTRSKTANDAIQTITDAYLNSYLDVAIAKHNAWNLYTKI